MSQLPAYDPVQSYRWNYEHAPDATAGVDVSTLPGDWSFCGLPVASPLGIPAGPLLNGKWILYYASLGFDVLTYKTVRSGPRECYPLPNLVPVAVDAMNGDEGAVPATGEQTGSWAVSFGMPSADPVIWREDIAETRRRLAEGQLLSVSVVGTIQPGWSIEELADDYALCGRWAAESGADCVEANLSCPNVSTCDGQLYQRPADAAVVAARIRAAVPDRPFMVKIGHMPDRNEAAALLDAIGGIVDAIVMTNSVAASVVDENGQPLFDGARRGICGRATREAALKQVETFASLVRERDLDMKLVGVGGIGTAADVRAFLDAGAESVQLATAAMLDPEVALKIRRDWPAL
ncbi:Dihydroorotate dehydrogenase B (NAD(+)), catalytic subunit [Maioricimonas rarisocia]|uniref:Dihydroorotate dehydrogenase B (NAD(+)), catalytic subunit n=1 Tax=Maioricimonas rarisocia TaxID=2528026 RepID=A0A517Z5S2_9PLAN|nr:hypothetical protein [Maioricimonas rarisocia]QDU37817.1 Dihydroorotate dehydrogenase B (NAD(+)), catalytic subunit [Maioricimonas rarisocia]